MLNELGLASPSDVVLFAAQLLRSGEYQRAIHICNAARGQFGSDRAIEVLAAMAELGQGEVGNAEQLLSAVRSTQPKHLVGLFTLAWAHAQSGNTKLAIEELLEVIRIYPDYPGAISTLSSFRMPGPSYRDVLSYIHRALAPKTYLEIGVETGATLCLAKTAERIAGVDPNLGAIRRNDLDSRTHLYESTSDDFFAEHGLDDVFAGRPLDLAFIDGMHQFEFVVRDIHNVEVWSNPQTVVVVHDVLPVLPIVAERERQTKFWVGDVWKSLWFLAELRTDLSVRVIPTPPSGLAVIRRLNRKHNYADSDFTSALTRYANLAYPDAQTGVLPESARIVHNSKSGWNAALGLSENSS
jgi:predicted O-methyltransferase YrrM